jgi:hypothetical protein
LWSPKELLVLLEKVCDRLCDLGEVFNETAAITSQTEEASNLFDILWRKPFNNSLDCIRIDGDAFCRYDMPKIVYFRKPKFTLGELGIKTMLAKFGENEAKMFFVFFLGFRVDKDIIKVYNNELVEVFHEDRVHESRESCWSIGETKGHNSVLVKTITSCESGLWNIFLADFYLMIAASQVQLRENNGARKLIKEVIYSRKGIFILDRLCIDIAIVIN